MAETHGSRGDEPVEGSLAGHVQVKLECEEEFTQRVDLGVFELGDIDVIEVDEELETVGLTTEVEVPDDVLAAMLMETTTPAGEDESVSQNAELQKEGVSTEDVQVRNVPDRDEEETAGPVGIGEPSEHAQEELNAALYLKEQIEGNLLYIKEHRTPATEKKTRQNVKRLQAWLAEKQNESRAIEDIPPRELDVYIGAFFISAKIEKGKRAGELYEPDTLTAMHRCFERYLKDHNYPVLITKDVTFSTSREVLSSRRKDLKKMGKGNKPNKAEYLSDEDMERFWELGLLGFDTPAALLHTLFVFFVMGFGMRPNHGSHQLRWGDVTLKSEKDMHGQTRRYLEWNERLTKTRAGQLDDGVRAFAPKVYDVAADNYARCPVRAYEIYAARRPPHCMEKDDPFFLGINQHAGKDAAVWYVNMQMGINTIIHIMPLMAQKAGLPGKITNYSLRRTMCTNLLNQNVPVNLITQVSGHKSVESLNHYAVASRSQQRAMSSITVGGNRPACRSLSAHPELPNMSSTLPKVSPEVESQEMGMAVRNFEPSGAQESTATKTVAVPTESTDDHQMMLRRLLSEVPPSVALKITGHSNMKSLVGEAYPEKSATSMAPRQPSPPEAESLVKGMLAGAHVQGNVAINVHYSMSNMGGAVTLSPQVGRACLEQ